MEVKPPETYAEWTEILSMLKDGTNDEAVAEAMHKGNLEWQPGVAERFSEKLVSTINFRINSATEKFQKNSSRASGRESAFIQCLLSLRKEMFFLYNTIDLPAIPEEYRQQYCEIVEVQANRIQSSLEDSAKADRSGKLGSIIKKHRINIFVGE